MGLYHQNTFTSSANLGSTSSSPITVPAGRYGLDIILATGSVDFQKLGADGSTYISVLQAPFSANGATVLDLPAGTYKVALTTATGVYYNLGAIS